MIRRGGTVERVKRRNKGGAALMHINDQNCFSDILIKFDKLGEKRVLECFSQEIFVHCGLKVACIK